MYNYFMLVGTICKDIEIKEFEDGKRVVNLVLAIQRPFQNMNGEYTTDFFSISVWEFLADLARERLKVGQTIGVKGRLVPRKITLESGATIYKYDPVGERIIYYNSRIDPAEALEKEEKELEVKED